MTLLPEEHWPVAVDSTAIAEQLDLDLALGAARTAAVVHASGDAISRRAILPFEGGWLRLMACVVPSLGVFGYKEFHLAANNTVRYSVHVFNVEDGRPVGVVDGALLTTLRTAATAALAVEQMVGGAAAVRLGIIGTGAEALAGLKALADVLAVTDVRVTSRREVNRDRFVAAVREDLDLSVTSVGSAAEAAVDSDVVYLATNSNGQIVARPEDLQGVRYVASIGSTLPTQRELDGRILAGASEVIVDTRDALKESGDMLEALEHGLDPARVRLLGDMGQECPDGGQRVYKSIGSPEQDLVLAHDVLRAAIVRGFGRHFEPVAHVKQNL